MRKQKIKKGKYCAVYNRLTIELVAFGKISNLQNKVIKSGAYPSDVKTTATVDTPTGQQVFDTLEFIVMIIPLIDFIWLWLKSKFTR